MNNERVVAILQTVVTLIFLSLGTVLIKLALTDVEPFTFAWVSVAIGMLAMTFYTFVLRRERIPRNIPREVWVIIISMGFFNFFVGRLTLTLSLDLLEATTNTYLTNFVGFLTMGMSIFILKESPTLFQILGAVLALIGLRVFFTEVPPPSQLYGVLLILIGILGIAYTNNVARKLTIITNRQLSNNIVSVLALLIGGGLLVAVGVLTDWPPRVSGWRNIGTLIYAGVVMTAVSMTVWNNILRTLRSYEASILGASTVIWTALLAIPFLGERLTANEVAGIVLMLIGLGLVQVRRGQLGRFGRRKVAADVPPELPGP